MSENEEIRKPDFKPVAADKNDEELMKIIYSSYFLEKDRRAREFLKKHPIPEEFRKKN
jgi:hypothetical protein